MKSVTREKQSEKENEKKSEKKRERGAGGRWVARGTVRIREEGDGGTAGQETPAGSEGEGHRHRDGRRRSE